VRATVGARAEQASARAAVARVLATAGWAMSRAAVVMAAEAMAMAAAAMAAAVMAAAAMVKVAHWAADRTTVAPTPGTCSGRSGGGVGWDAARVEPQILKRKVQGWAKETSRRSLALCERRLPKKLLES
jgi:hypothetical protein